MEFNAVDRSEACWRTWEGDGVQRVVVWADGSLVIAEGSIVREGREGFAAMFRIVCDELWQVRSADVYVAGAESLRLRCDGEAGWTDASGTPLPQFDGCVDIDLQASPITNTLPIRRAGLGRDQTREFRMVYVPFPDLRPFVDTQRYTCLEPGSRYLYEAADGSFSAEVPVDGDGLVLDYPPLFRRVL